MRPLLFHADSLLLASSPLPAASLSPHCVLRLPVSLFPPLFGFPYKCLRGRGGDFDGEGKKGGAEGGGKKTDVRREGKEEGEEGRCFYVFYSLMQTLVCRPLMRGKGVKILRGFFKGARGRGIARRE